MNPVTWSFKFALVMLVSGACFASAIVVPCIPNLITHFGINVQQSYHIVSFYLFGYLLGQFIHAFINKSIGYRRCLLTGFFIYSGSSFLQIISIHITSFDLFLWARFLSAFGAAAGPICMFAMVADIAHHKKEFQKCITLAFFSLTLFTYLTITVGGLITQYGNWKLIFDLVCAVALSKFLLIIFSIPRSRTQSIFQNQGSNLFKDYCKKFANIKLVSASFIIAFATTSTYLYNAIAASLSLTYFKITPADFGYYSVFNMLCVLLGGWISNKIAVKLSMLKVLSIGITVVLISLFLFLILYDQVFAVSSGGVYYQILVGILNIGIGIIYPSASNLALRSESCTTTASSVMNIIKMGSPTLAVGLLSHFHLQAVASFIIPMCCFSAITVVNFFVYIYFHTKEFNKAL